MSLLNSELKTQNSPPNKEFQNPESKIQNNNLLAANIPVSNGASTDVAATSDTTVSAQSDLSQYIKGIFVKDTSGDMVNVVSRDDNIDTVQKNQSRIDLNHDNIDDIIMWDQKQIWIKYSHPEKSPAATATFTRLYRTPTFSSPTDIAKAVQKGGRINVAGSTFKIWDSYTAPEGFSLEGQNYDAIALQRKNNHPYGYLVQLSDLVTNRHLSMLNKNNTKYVLVLASGTNLQGLFLNTDLLG